MKQYCYDKYALQAFADNQLVPVEHEAVSRHLLSCPHCRALVAELQAVALPLRECPPARPPADLHSRLTAAMACHSPLPVVACEQALEMASAAVDGELGAEDARLLHAHLDGCANCARIADEFTVMSRALQETTPAQVPADLHDRIRTAVSPAPARTVETGVVHLFQRVRWITVGAAAAAALLVALFIGLPGSGPEHITPTAPAVVVQVPETASPDMTQAPVETTAATDAQEATVAAETATPAPADAPAARPETPPARPAVPVVPRRERAAREPASPRPAVAAVTTPAPAPAPATPATPAAVAAAPAPPAAVAAPSAQPDLAAADRRQPVRTMRTPRLDGTPAPGSSAALTETAVALAPPSRALAETVRTTTPSAQSPGATLEKASPGPETAARPATLDKKPRTSYVARTERAQEIYRSDDNSTHLVAMGSKVKRDLEIAARSEPRELLILR